jgi:integrase/recombinase XerD
MHQAAIVHFFRETTAYLDAAGLRSAPREEPLFRRLDRRSGAITPRAMAADDMGRRMRWRMAALEFPTGLCPHSFRVATITDLLSQGVPLEDVQNLVGHSDPRTTRLYDRRPKRVMRSVVDRISV